MLLSKINYILLVIFTLSTISILAQDGNPFDMEHKIIHGANWKEEVEVILPREEKEIDTTSIIDKEVGIIDSTILAKKIEGNPFDIGVSDNTSDEIKTAPVPIPKPRPIQTESIKSSISQFKIGISILLMVAMALISTLLRHVILKVIDAFKSDNLLRTYFRNVGRRLTFPIFLLEIFFIVNAAFACFLVFNKLNLLQESPILDFLKILLGFSIVIFGKHLALFVIQEVFPIRKEVAEYNFTIVVFLSILGLILMPCNLILGFAPEPMSNISMYFIGIVSVLVLGYLAVRALLIGSKFLSTNRFHFFMYLCTVEIAPLFILIKVVKNYLGS